MSDRAWHDIYVLIKSQILAGNNLLCSIHVGQDDFCDVHIGRVAGCEIG